MSSEQNKINSKESLKDNPDFCSIPPIEENETPIKESVSKNSLKQNFPEQHTKSRSYIPKLSSFGSSNSSLESLGAPPPSSKTSLRKNANASRTSLIPSCLKSSNSTYILALEKEYESLQMAFFALTSQFAKVQFRLRQIIQARPDERDHLLAELTHVAFCGIDDEMELTSSMPQMKKDLQSMGNLRRRQGYLIDRLRSQLEQLSESSGVCEKDKVVTPRKSVRICENAKK